MGRQKAEMRKEEKQNIQDNRKTGKEQAKKQREK